MTDRDLVHRTETVVDRTKLRKILGDRIIQLKQPPILKLHYGNTCKRLCVRGPMPDGVSIDTLVLRGICQPISEVCDRCAVPQEYETTANHAGSP